LKEIRFTLITGKQGFIGSALAESLDRQGALVRDIGDPNDRASRDITNISNVKSATANAELSEVFHLAGKSSPSQSWEDATEYFNVNVVGTYNLLQCIAARQDGDSIPFVFSSSSSVYGNTNAHILFEKDPVNPSSPYGLSKSCAESVCGGFFSVFGMRVVIARPFYVCGSRLNRGIVFDVANAIARSELSNDRVTNITIGDPDVVIDIVDVRDCVDAMLILSRKGKSGETYNISTGNGHSIGEIIEILFSKSKTKLELHTNNDRDRPKDTPRLVGSSSKLESLGWTRRWSIDQTISDVLQHCRKREGKEY
jgi:GDP-4-dehydro-6-deoxy-D-mannose reductase